ncbi:hypothetical protein K501DRAFT_228423 [Backusella circina FSU 941]|nr:hypothetical protein K501DRAFT_228423 [Backusella circina FSU 941]
MSFWSAKTLDKCTGKWNFIPSKESVQYTLHRLISASLLIDKLKVTLVETYRANSTLLKLEHFISLALVYMSLCSRLYTLCNQMLLNIEACYQMLYEWQLTSFPSGLKQKEQIQFQQEFNLDCDEDTFKVARAAFSKEAMNLKSSDLHKVHLETYMASHAVMEKVKEIAKEIGAEETAGLDDFEDLGEPIER